MTGLPAPSSVEKVIDALREGITGGSIPPGTSLYPAAIGREHGITTPEATSALAILRGEGIIHSRHHHRYAAPAGPPDSADTARLGRLLARMRHEAGCSREDLCERADGHGWWWSPYTVEEAEDGQLQPREFWEQAYAVLGADGTLIDAHDRTYPAQRSGPQPGTPARAPALHRITGEIRDRVLAGDWPPGTVMDKTALAREHAITASYVGLALSALGAEGLLDPPRAGYRIPAAGPPPGRRLAGAVPQRADGTATVSTGLAAGRQARQDGCPAGHPEEEGQGGSAAASGPAGRAGAERGGGDEPGPLSSGTAGAGRFPGAEGADDDQRNR